MNYLESFDKRDCFGCGACAQICPVTAITMQADGEGFLYPIIDEERCIRCGACSRACPTSHSDQKVLPMCAMAGVNHDRYIRRESASGGAFGAILSAAGTNTVVFGAKWEGRSKVRHAAAPVARAYDQFHKSKYVQSDIGHTFQEAKEYLLQNLPVIFTGTPCQIAGLRGFLGRDYANLLCVDLVCHGVPSEKVLEMYLRRKDRRNDPVDRIDFRYKKYGHGKWDSKCAQIYYASGKKKTVDYDSSGYLRGFANGLFFRPSCSICPYAQSQRVSDITIGDYWGIERKIPELNPHEGVSLLFANTEKGRQFLQRMTKYINFYPTDLDSAINGNARLRKPDPGHKDRTYFFSRLDKDDFERLVQKCVPRISMIRKLGHEVKKMIRKW